ncbi:hypothetical protein M758_1G323500 [Ceratodon purpureus]|uniref:Uncharacterized protein n=1 Tax=Ceratodon purpureus TaxID=3225 RepID=A0A8T0JFK9_CERPU|nr:hypothetical protein KC19_N041800 [Ceratodon purpureus]KAG0593451.1 hypothetical protein KC19_1G330800 [Ceratodon purpureus]KAG0632380.1 hypothetical protein M758_1G323500 [Ceratodon purpureus]
MSRHTRARGQKQRHQKTSRLPHLTFRLLSPQKRQILRDPLFGIPFLSYIELLSQPKRHMFIYYSSALLFFQTTECSPRSHSTSRLTSSSTSTLSISLLSGSNHTWIN